MSTLRQPLVAGAASFLVVIAACGDLTVPVVESGSSAAAAKGGKPPKVAPDGQAPTVPVFVVLDRGPTHITLKWSSTDPSAPILYSVAKDGGPSTWTFDSTGTFKALQQSTTYTFTAKARDMAGNWSQLSAPFSVTTAAPDPNDVTPPTAPANLWANLYEDGTREMQVTWTPSTDNVTPQVAIIYHMYINGVLENSSAGIGQTSGYGVAGENVVTVVAVDGAGNRSVAGTVTLFIPF